MILLGDIDAVSKQVRAFLWVLASADWPLKQSILDKAPFDLLGGMSSHFTLSL